MAAAAAAAGESNGVALEADSVRIVDLRLLSQAELYALSRCAPSPSFCDDVVIPKIDRSVFNESAGSRKQTYSRLRLAPASSSAAASRRRAPHVRPSAPVTNTANCDPENAENAQIVSMLKKLFMPNADPMDSGELVNVKVDYSDSVLPEQLVSNVSPVDPVDPVTMDYSTTPVVVQQLVTSTGQKRKRGRPRKDGVLRREVERASNVDLEIDVKEKVVVPIFKHENADDRDKELLNRDGVALDLRKLGAQDHPFWDEVKRRTQGRRTEEELLDFLKGLEGQWGSRRKKKRIVDASEFGDALPVGWKVLLSCKKKNGVVWLYCRRYISPGGRQFVSCKEVASYLISLHGLQDPNMDLLPQNDTAIESTPANQLSQTPDFAAQSDAKNEIRTPSASSPALASDVSMKAADKSEGRIRENLHCKKCNVSFSDKVELLQHNSSLHPKNRSRSSVSIADGVIVRDGFYECRFCQKTYTEMHRMTGHIGAHVKYREKMAGELPPESIGGSVAPIAGDECPTQDITMTGTEGVSVSINDGLNNCFPCDKDSANVEHSVAADVVYAVNIRGPDETNGVVTVTTSTSVNEVLTSKDEDTDFHENPHDAAHVNDSTADIVDDGSIDVEHSVAADVECAAHVEIVHNCSPSAFDGSTDGVAEISTSVENPKQDMVSESNLIDSSNHMEACDTTGANVDACETRSNELKLDDENFAANEATFDILESGNEQEKNASAIDFLESGDGQDKDTSAVDFLESCDGQEKNTSAVDFLESCDGQEKNTAAVVFLETGDGQEKNTSAVDFLESSDVQEKNTAAVVFLESGNGQEKNTLAVDFLESGNGQEKDAPTVVEQHSHFMNLSCTNISNIEGSSTSGSTLSKCSKMNPVFNMSMPVPSNDKESPAEENVCSVSRGADYETHSFGICDKRSPEVNYVGESHRHEEMNAGISSLFPSWNEHVTFSEKYNSDSLLSESRVHNKSDGRLVAGHESNQAAQNNDSICGRKTEVSPFDDIQSIRGVEVSDPFGSSYSTLDSDSMIDKEYPREDNMFKLFSTVLEDQNQKPSGGVLFDQSAEVSHAGYSGNEIYPSPMNQSKLKEFESPREHDLSLSFGNFQKDMQTDSSRVELDRYSTDSFNFQTIAPQNYGDQSRSDVLNASRTSDVISFRNLRTEQQRSSNRTDQEQFVPQGFNFQPFVPQNYVDQTRLNVVNPNRPGDVFPFANVQKELQSNSDRGEQAKYSTGSFGFQSHVSQNYSDQTRLGVGNTNTQDDVKKQARRFGIDFLDSSFNRANELPGSLNMPPIGGGWNRSAGVKLGTPDHNMILGFGRNSSQSVDGLANSPWTSGRGNDFQDSFGITPTPQVQASSGFGAFDLRQNQGQGSSYGMTERYNGGTSTYGASRPEPVEYSFMGQSPNSLPGDSKIYQYDTSAEQGLNSSYWLGKDALMHGISPATQAPAECAWCKTVFYHDPVQSGVQSGAIGVICPSCTSRYPG